MNALEEKKRYFATKNNRPSTFQEYLEYWFWEVFFPKCTSKSVQMKNFWIIYYVIRPQPLPDCPLDKLDRSYLDTLLENCQKYCQCAGYTVYKFLNIVLSHACMEGFLPELISPRKEYPVPDSDIQLYNKEQLKRLLIPLMFEQVLTALMGSVGTIMVTNIGSAAIFAVSLVDSLNILIINIFTAMATGGTIICAQYLG